MIWKFLLILAVMAVGYYIPKAYSDNYRRRYGEDGICFPLSIITAIICVIWLILWDVHSFWFWLFFAALLVAVVLCVIYCLGTARQVGASAFDTVLSIVMQLLSTAGIVIFALLLIAAITNSGKKRKK